MVHTLVGLLLRHTEVPQPFEEVLPEIAGSGKVDAARVYPNDPAIRSPVGPFMDLRGCLEKAAAGANRWGVKLR
eukprot:scaffold1147_cov250-Pinguiococcus_pyrenoidosus.AAC.5